MVLRLGRLPVWVGPTEVVQAARAVIGWTDDAVELVAGLPTRITGLLDEVDGLVRRISRAVDEVERLVEGVDATLRRVDAVVATAGEVTLGVGEVLTTATGVATRADTVAAAAAGVAEHAGRLVEEASSTSGAASRLLELYAPVAERAAPLAGRFVEQFSEAELQAAIRMIDQLPQLTHHIETDIIPILATLDRVGPDVHQLLDVLQDVRLAIQGVPGFRMLRRWGERDEADPAT